MIVVHLDAVSLARVRLAVSPASEAISWLRLTATNNRHPIFGDPGPTARTALREPDVALLAEVVAVGAAGYTPDLVTPKPPLGSAASTFGQQLELVRQTPDEAVARQLAEVPFPGGRIPPRVRRAVDDGSFARRAATGLCRFWRATIAEQWGQLKETLDVDLAQRASTMAGAGLGGCSAPCTGRSTRPAPSCTSSSRTRTSATSTAPSWCLRPRPWRGPGCTPRCATLGTRS